MDNNTFDKICETVSTYLEEYKPNYNIMFLKGKRGETNIRCMIVVVNGQNYLQVDSDSFITYQDIFPKTKFQVPKYRCAPNEDGNFVLTKNSVEILQSYTFSIANLIDLTFGELKSKMQDTEDVADMLSQLMNRCILPEKIGYDVNTQSYYFLDWNSDNGEEWFFFSEYFHNLRKEGRKPLYLCSCIAKYTSLETALLMLNSGKMRMMSVTAMNDRMEIGHIYGKLCNEESTYLEDKTKLHIARSRYITSFTDKIDDLTMWRLYGDNGNGVCLLFLEPRNCNYFYPVDYANSVPAICLKTKKICDEMEKVGFKFSFKSLETVWQFFLKPIGFSDEAELRYLRIDNTTPDGYLVASNGIISGYKDLTLDDENDNSFPALLNGIILGPNMKNVEINKFQLESLAREKGVPLIKGVRKSSIDYYI